MAWSGSRTRSAPPRPRGGGGGGFVKKTGDGHREWVPTVDKDPFYRTNDIFNSIFRRGKQPIKLLAGPRHCTDLENIFVNFNEKREALVTEDLGIVEGDKHVYRLDCGHKRVGKTERKVGDEADCKTCGGDGAFLGFEHEWTHIYFKSDLILRKLFVDQLLAELKRLYPQVDWAHYNGPMEEFLHLTVNAWDDIRVNSLQEKVRAGSAERLWARWTRILKSKPEFVEQSFPHYVMACAMGIPTKPDGQFAPLRPTLEYAGYYVRYRGMANMLVVVRWALDRCMGSLIEKLPPPPPAQPQPPPQQNQQGGQSAPQNQQQGGAGSAGSGDRSDQPDQADGGQGDSDPQSGAQPAAPQDPQAPSGADAAKDADKKDVVDAVKTLVQGAKPVDPGEDHGKATQQQVDDAQKQQGQALRAQLHKIFGQDPQGLGQALQQGMDPNTPDPDVQAAIAQLQQANTSAITRDSLLTGDAKAKLLVIDVKPEHITEPFWKERHDLEEEHDRLVRAKSPSRSEMERVLRRLEEYEQEDIAIARMRANFFRTLGRMRMKRDESGSTLDIDNFIQFLVESGRFSRSQRGASTTLDIFEEERVSKGFYELTLVDMSGSMMGDPFRLVCHGHEMIKAALDFPFVFSDMWGFRGTEELEDRNALPDFDPKSIVGEVWIYRYDRRCSGYIGSVPIRVTSKQSFNVPVECGGITPMNTALHVGIQHCRRQPSGMTKRLILLTDGAPFQQKIDSGRKIPEFLLRQFVRKEVMAARAMGIDVITLIIGGYISDEHANYMFGSRKKWRRVVSDPSSPASIDRVLTALMLDNFTKFLRSRA